jgi:hypothetical protein
LDNDSENVDNSWIFWRSYITVTYSYCFWLSKQQEAAVSECSADSSAPKTLERIDRTSRGMDEAKLHRSDSNCALPRQLRE